MNSWIILATAVDVGLRPRAGFPRASVRKARCGRPAPTSTRILREPDLSLESIARSNGISLRYLHELFTAMDSSVSDWIWLRRLQQCYALLTHPEHAASSITEIAFSMGFNSSSHFSNRFREQFGLRPSDVRLGGSAERARARCAASAGTRRALGAVMRAHVISFARIAAQLAVVVLLPDVSKSPVTLLLKRRPRLACQEKM